MNGQVMVGIDVGGTSLKGALVDRRGALVGNVETAPTRAAGEDSAAVIEKMGDIAEVLVQAGRRELGEESVAGIGIIVPGIVDENRGVALVALNLEWHGDPLVDRIGRRLALPTFLGHDARAAGLAEGLWGAARNSDDYLFIAIGTGVGAAMVLGGQPYFRPGGAGGEFGHASVNATGLDCACGRRGCLEAYSSGRSIGSRYTHRSNSQEPVTGKEVLERMQRGDGLAAAVWREAVWALATSIVNSIAMFAPDIVIVGGGVAEAGDLLFGPLREEVKVQMPSFHLRPPPEIAPARFRKNAGIVGAAARAWLESGVSRYELVTDRRDP